MQEISPEAPIMIGTYKQSTPGSELTAELRRYFSIGPRTRDRRVRGRSLRHDMREAICYAAIMPGYFVEHTQDALRPGFAAVNSWDKHVEGFRLDGVTIMKLQALSPWQFAALLGQMVDVGISNVADGGVFLAAAVAA